MMAHNLSENSTNVAPARIIQPPNEKVTNSGIQSENQDFVVFPILVFRFDHLGYLAFFHSSN
jgi:hypothetical protein